MYEEQLRTFPSPESSESDLKKILDPTDVYRDINVYGFLYNKKFVHEILANYTHYLNHQENLTEVRMYLTHPIAAPQLCIH
jgi:hypothetical protein